MKRTSCPSSRIILATGMLLFSGHLFGQAKVEVRTAYTESVGVVGQSDSAGVYVTNEAGTEPVRFLYSKETAYVDESGNLVTVAAVKSGLPVTIHYSIVGESLIVSKVILRKAAATAVTRPAAVESVTMSQGTIRTLGRDHVVITPPSSRQSVAYQYSEGTVCVDEAGDPVSIEEVKVGLPVTIYYAQSGDLRTANRIVVRGGAVPPDSIIEKKTTREL